MRTKNGRSTIGWVVMIAGLVTMTPPVCAAGEGDGRSEREALRRALRLVALDADVKVRLIDPDLAPDPEPMRRLDAFVAREPDGAIRRVIYVNYQSEIVRQAAAGSELFVSVLAAVIHHEAQHLNGATETEARRAETDFFRSLVARGEVSLRPGQEYLRLLVWRDAQPVSSHEGAANRARP